METGARMLLMLLRRPILLLFSPHHPTRVLGPLWDFPVETGALRPLLVMVLPFLSSHHPPQQAQVNDDMFLLDQATLRDCRRREKHKWREAVT